MHVPSGDAAVASTASVALPRLRRSLDAVDGGAVAVLGACGYIALFALPLPFDGALLALAAGTALATVRGRGAGATRLPRALAIALGAWLASLAASLVACEDVRRAALLSAPLLPGALLFLAITGHARAPDDARRLYRALSALALGLAVAVLASAWCHPELHPDALVASVGTPALLVPNDVTLLAVVAPLAWSLCRSRADASTTLLAGCALLASAAAVAVLQSRVAALAMIAGVAGAAGRRTAGRALCVAGLLAVAVVTLDLVRGLPLLRKFTQGVDPRLALWIAALAMFRDAPWLGHGPHSFGLLEGSYVSALVLPSWIPLDDRAVPWAHNLYLEALAEQGIGGLVALVAVLATALRLAHRAALHGADDETRVLAAGTRGALIAIAVAALVELSFVREWVVVVTSTLVALTSHHSALRAPQQEVPS